MKEKNLVVTAKKKVTMIMMMNMKVMTIMMITVMEEVMQNLTWNL